MSSPTPFTAPQARDDQLADLLRASADGDVQAFQRFYDSTVRDALEFARKVGGGDLEDLLTRSYLRAWRDAPRFDPARGRVIDWLLAIVRNRAPGATNDSEFSP